MAAREKLIDTKLRLSEQERAEVERLRGDRVQNTCLRRAVQQWIVRENALQEATMLGLYANGPIPVQPVGPPRPEPGDTVFTPLTRNPPAQPAQVPPPVPNDPPEEDDPEEEQPARRRPPTSAETWGAGGPDRAS